MRAALDKGVSVVAVNDPFIDLEYMVIIKICLFPALSKMKTSNCDDC